MIELIRQPANFSKLPECNFANNFEQKTEGNFLRLMIWKAKWNIKKWNFMVWFIRGDIDLDK